MVVIFIAVTVAGCASTFTLTYETNAKFDCGESYTYSLMEFAVTPVPNGIIVLAYNKSDADVFLDWDKSHIVMPNGESSTARVMGSSTDKATAPPAAGPMVRVAPKRRVVSLISSAAYADELDPATAGAICSDWRTRGSSDSWLEGLFRAGNYWPTVLTTAKRGDGDRVTMAELASFVRDNDHLMLAIAYEERGLRHECRVTFRFKEINAVDCRKRLDPRSHVEEIYNCRDEYVFDVSAAVWRKL